MAVRPSDGLPKRFTGDGTQKPLAHWYAFENYMKIQNKPEENFLDSFKLTVSDDALIWVVDNSAQFTTQDILKNKFLDRFSGHLTRQGKANEFRNLRLGPNETVGQFASKLRSLGARLGQTDQLMLDQFYWGLPPQIRMAVLMQAPKTIADAVKHAENMMEANPQLGKEVSFSVQEENLEMKELREIVLALKEDVEKGRNRSHSPGGQQRDKSPYPRGRPTNNGPRGQHYDQRGRSRERSANGRDHSANRGRAERGYGTPRYGEPNRRFDPRDHYRGQHFGAERGPFRAQQGRFDNSRQPFRGECWKCGKYGHRSAECRSNMAYAVMTQENGEGHF